MRVMHLISGGDTGGAKTHVITLLGELKKQVNIELVCLSGGIFYDEAVENNIPTVLYEQKNRFDLSVLKKIANDLNEGAFDILHCHGARANFVSVFLRSRIHIPIITTIHSDYRLDFAHQWYKKIIFTNLNRWSLNRMDYYLAVTDKFKEMLIGQGFDGQRIYTIYNGIKIGYSLKKYSQVRESKNVIFGCATRLVPIKGTHVLLEAAKICLDKGYKPQIRIAGHGESSYTDQLKTYIHKNKLSPYVEMLGFVTDMDAFYDSIDVNILPSFTESFPYALLEGGVRGIASVATKAGGIVEMIGNHESGELFEPGDSKALAEIMIKIMEGQVDLAKLGMTFHQRIVDKFSAEAMAKRHNDVYVDIIDKYRNKTRD